MLKSYGEKYKHEPNKYASPDELPYMIHIIRILELYGSWPYEELKIRNLMPKGPYKIAFYIYFVGAVCGVSYLVKHQNVLGFAQLGHCYITVFMTFILLHRMSMSWFPSFYKVVLNFMQNIHLFHFRDKSEYALRIYNEVFVILKYLVLIMVLQGAISAVAFVLLPLYFNYTDGMYGPDRPPNKTFDNTVFYDLPFDYENDLRGHIIVFGFNCLVIPHSALLFVSFDTLLLVIVFNLWGHVKILKHRLNHFPPPANTENANETPFYNDEEMTNVTSMLKEIIKYHKLISDYNNDVVDAFGIMMASYSLFHQVCLCILLLKCAQNDIAETMRYGLILLYMIQQLILVSVIIELLCSESETIKDAVYAVPWECMDTKNRKIVHILLFVSQTSMEFKAMGMVRIGLQTMSAILKTTFSYFMLLRTFA